VTAWNANPLNATNQLVPLPSALYQIVTKTITIPSGGRKATIQLKIPNATLLDVNLIYGIGITLVSNDAGVTISSNLKKALFAISAKNAYDANYTVTGFLFHPTGPRSISLTKRLSTAGAIRLQAPLGDLGPQGYAFQFDVIGGTTLGNWAAVGACPPAPQSGFYTADNPGGIAYPGPELPGVAPFLYSLYNNTYNATTNTFWMHYGYGVGSSDQTGWSRNVYEKWVRQ
jgi:hypothetical protein